MKTIAALTSAILAIATAAIGATTVTTDPVGYVTGTCKANSDTVVSVPLAHAPEFVGVISAAASINGENATITASGSSPAWAANQFAALYNSTPSYPTYYIKFKSGALNGKYFTVTANSDSSLTFDTNGDDATGAVAGDQFAVIKYWTLGDLFPPETQPTIVRSNGTGKKGRGSELLIPDLSSPGINRGPYTFILATINETTSWIQLISTGIVDATNQIIYPDTYFTIRHPSSSADTTYTFSGSVNTDAITIPLSTLATGANDNFVSLQRPVGVKLSESGLSSGFTVSTSTGKKGRGDELYIYDNATVGKMKGPASIFILLGTDWYKISDSGVTISNDFQVEPGMGCIVRKIKSATEATAFWKNTPNY